MKQQLENLNFSKTVLMILVILGHSVAFWTGNWFTKNPVYGSSLLKYIYLWVSSFHTYCFALISGYIFSWKMSGGEYTELKSFIKNKFSRLITPFIFMSAIWVIPAYILLMDGSFIGIVKNYILATSPSQLWFLLMLFWVSILAWIGWKSIRNKPIVGLIACIFFYIIGVIWCRFLPNFYCLGTALQYALFYYIGCMIQINESSDDKTPIFHRIPAIAWIFTNIIVFVLSRNLIEDIETTFFIESVIGFAVTLIGTISAFYFLQDVGSRISWKENKMFCNLTKCTMPMYLFHQQLIYLSIVLLNGRVSPCTNAIVNFAFAFIVSYILSRVVLHYKYTRILIGEKKLSED